MNGDWRTFTIIIFMPLIIITNHVTSAEVYRTHCDHPSNCKPGETCRGACFSWDGNNTESKCLGQCVPPSPSCQDMTADCQRFMRPWICNYTSMKHFCRKSCGSCVEHECLQDEFMCDGKCQSEQLFCDGVQDCEDNGDETGCTDFRRYQVKPNQGTRRCGVRSLPLRRTEGAEGTQSITDVPNRHRSKRLVKAKYARAHSWPWVGFLETVHGRYRSICSATLIHAEWALTAAHCLDKAINNSSYLKFTSISFGQHSTRQPSLSEKNTRQVRSVTKIIPHHSYHPDDMFDDIALLKLDSPVIRTDFVNVACMPFENDFMRFHEKGGVITGWGFDENSRLPRSLKQVVMKPMGFNACAEELRNYLTSTFLTRVATSLLCTEKEEKASGGLCSGDSGGPLVSRRVTGAYAVVGVSVFTSHESCNQVGSASVFNNVLYYSQWIRKYVRDLEYV